MSDTDGVTTPLWTDERIDHVFGKETIGAMFVRGLRDDLTATAQRIAELEAELEAASQDAMTQNNEVVRLTALVDLMALVEPDATHGKSDNEATWYASHTNAYKGE